MACAACGKGKSQPNLYSGREFAVFLNGEQVGDNHTDPGAAAKVAKQCGGMIKMVPAQS